MSSSGEIAFLGDSLLDDFYWLQDKSRDLTKEVHDLGFTVNNYAVDGSKLNDIIEGIVPSDIYMSERSYPYPIDNEGKVCPLKLLSYSNKPTNLFTSVYGDIILNKCTSSTCSFMKPILKDTIKSDNKYISRDDVMIVISIGGNDLRTDMIKILFGLDPFFNGIVTPEYQDKFDKMLAEVKKKSSKIVLISMYLPYLGSGSTYGSFGYLAVAIVNKWKEFIVPLAKKHNIAILDLAQTFDNKNRSNYGTIEVQPSNVSNKSIAKCLQYIYNKYDGYGVYFAPNCDISQIQVTK